MEFVKRVCRNAAERTKVCYQHISERARLYHLIYFGVFLEIVWIAAYYFSPVGKAALNSDMTTGVQFLEQVIKEKSLYPKNWIYTNTIGLPLLTPIILILYLVTGDYIVTTLLKFLVYLILMAVSVWYFSGHVLKMGKSLTAVVIFILLSPGSKEYFNDLFYSGYTYRAAVFFLLLGFGLQCIQDSSLTLNIKYLCLYAGSIFLFVTGDIRYAATIILPLVVAVAAVYFTENGQTDIKKIFLPLRNFLFYIAASGAAVCLCILVENYLKSKYTYVSGYYSGMLISDLSDMWGRLKYMVNEYIRAFGFAGGVRQMSFSAVLSFCSLAAAGYILVVNPVRMMADYKKLPFVLKQIIIYRWTGYAVIIFFWLFTKEIVFRHALTFMVLDIFLAVYYIAGQTLLDGKAVKVFGCAVIIFYMIFNWSHGTWLDLPSNWNSAKAAAVLENREKIIEEIKGRGLTYGYAPYWTASVTAAFSQQQIKIYPWELYDRYRWYAPDELYLSADQDEATFLLMPENIYKEYLKKDDFSRLWGSCQEMVKMSDYVLLIYDYNIAVNFDEFSCFSDNMLKNMRISEKTGQKKPDASAIYLKPEQYIFGPYTKLAHGRYTLNVSTSGESFLSSYAMQTKDGQSETKYICQSELKAGNNKISFYLFEDIEKVEFNIANRCEEEIMVTNLSLEYRGEDMLLGQMQVSQRDERNSDDTIWLAPGEVMFGPYVRADSGKYRVNVTVSHDTQLNVWAEKSGKKIVQQALSSGENEMIFELTETVEDLEFVIRNTGNKELKITGMQVEFQQ